MMLRLFSTAYNFFTKLDIPVNQIWQNKIIPGIMEIIPQRKHAQEYKNAKNYLSEIMKELEAYPSNTNIDTIYDLEHIADINPQYHWLIMNMLMNLIKNHTLAAKNEDISSDLSHKASPFIQAAMTVIAGRDRKKDPQNEQIDLSFADLRGINLQGANLKQINLYQANLAGVNLSYANLEGVILTAANLENANLNFANLSEAILSAASLNQANLMGANLQRANLYLANLEGAILSNTLLDDANLREVKLTH